MCLGTRVCVKSGVFRTKSSSLNHHRELTLISVSVVGRRVVQILIFLLLYSQLAFLSLFLFVLFCFVFFVLSIRTTKK